MGRRGVRWLDFAFFRAIILSALCASLFSTLILSVSGDFGFTHLDHALFVAIFVLIQGYSLVISLANNAPPKIFRFFFIQYESVGGWLALIVPVALGIIVLGIIDDSLTSFFFG
jgi:hypothetical protein